MIEQGPHYPITDRKQDTVDLEIDPYGLIDLRRSFKEENLAILRKIALKYRLVIRVVPPLENEAVDEGEIFIEIDPLFGNELPDWKGFWKEYKELKKKKR